MPLGLIRVARGSARTSAIWPALPPEVFSRLAEWRWIGLSAITIAIAIAIAIAIEGREVRLQAQGQTTMLCFLRETQGNILRRKCHLIAVIYGFRLVPYCATVTSLGDGKTACSPSPRPARTTMRRHGFTQTELPHCR